jgi:hypothetical protein
MTLKMWRETVNREEVRIYAGALRFDPTTGEQLTPLSTQ